MTNKEQENAPVDFHSVLRLRPLLKKEREEQVVLEHVPSTCTVVLHPMPNPRDLLSPSSQLVLQTISPAQQTSSEEFNFDTVLPQGSSQDKVYFSLGHSMAQSAMEPLKSLEPESTPIKSNLVITMGLIHSGKTFSCWGDGPILKRRAAGDGLLPRMIDSLFSQSKHHLAHKRGHSFAVSMLVLQVNQNKKTGECKIHDLLQPLQRRFLSLSSDTSPPRSRTDSVTHKSSYSSLDEPVLIEQDPISFDCVLVNGQVRLCDSPEEARANLHAATNHRRRLKNTKKYDSHVFVQVQPLLLDKSGKTILEGGRIALLDMASIEESKKKVARTTGIRDALPSRSDAHTAVLHCLRALKVNADNPDSQKKVPFLGHKITMLLQPLFSAHFTDHTLVTLFLAAYTGHRQYTEKQELLNDIHSLHRVPPTRGAVTGVEQPIARAKNTRILNKSPVKYASDADDEGSVGEKQCNKKKKNQRVASKAEPKGSSRSMSMTYSDSSEESEEVVPLPPPVAPGYTAPSLGIAPVGDSYRAPSAPTYEESIVSDFPGAPVPPTPVYQQPPRQADCFDMSDEENANPIIQSPPMKQPQRQNSLKENSRKTLTRTPSNPEMRAVLRMASTAASFESKELSAQQKLEERLELLEAKNAFLERENATLRERNDSLQRENEQLRRDQPATNYSVNVTLQPNTTAAPSEPPREVLSTSKEQSNMFDNPLFQHMAQLNKPGW